MTAPIEKLTGSQDVEGYERLADAKAHAELYELIADEVADPAATVEIEEAA